MKKRNVEGLLDEHGAEIFCFQGRSLMPVSITVPLIRVGHSTPYRISISANSRQQTANK
jgi:hypothetical protein